MLIDGGGEEGGGGGGRGGGKAGVAKIQLDDNTGKARQNPDDEKKNSNETLIVISTRPDG